MNLECLQMRLGGFGGGDATLWTRAAASLAHTPDNTGTKHPPWRQPRGKWMVSSVNSLTNATSRRRHLWEIDLRFALNSTPGRSDRE